ERQSKAALESQRQNHHAAGAPLFPKLVSNVQRRITNFEGKGALEANQPRCLLAGRNQYGKSKCERKDLWCLATAVCINARQACERQPNCHGPDDSASPGRNLGP